MKTTRVLASALAAAAFCISGIAIGSQQIPAAAAVHQASTAPSQATPMIIFFG